MQNIKAVNPRLVCAFMSDTGSNNSTNARFAVDVISAVCPASVHMLGSAPSTNKIFAHCVLSVRFNSAARINEVCRTTAPDPLHPPESNSSD